MPMVAMFVILPVLYIKSSIISSVRTETVYLNGFIATAYCPGSCCNGKWAGMAATGRTLEYYTNRGINVIAVDPRVIPLGSRLLYNGIEYTAVDTGRVIKGRRLDVFMPSHADTLKFGVRKDQKIVIKYQKLKGIDITYQSSPSSFANRESSLSAGL